MRHQGGQAIVVTEADLLVGDGVVLVDDRDHAQVGQVPQRPAGVEVLRAVHEVERGQQDLPGQHAVRLEAVLPQAHEAVLPDGRDGLQDGGVRGPLGAAVRARSQPAEMAPDVTTTTVCPPARAAASSPQSRCTVSLVTDDEPTLTTAITARPPR